ncbi:MAG: SPOR domain-containing protein [Bdellovibrio sp.]
MASKSDMVVKLVLVFFISLLSFSVGIFAGKKYSDNQHTLAQLEPQKGEKTAREVASVNNEENSEKKSGTMSDEEIAKLAEEFVSDEKAPTAEGHGETVAKEAGHGEKAVAAHGEVAHTETKHEAAPAKAVATQEPSTVAKDLAAGKAPAAHTAPEAKTVTKENRIPSSLPANVAQYTVGKFTVQVASYNNEDEAQKMASELKDKGYSAFYIPANIKGKTWFRVSVGQFATPKEAASYRTELLAKAKVSSAIVQKITE